MVRYVGQAMGKPWAKEFNAALSKTSDCNPSLRKVRKVYQVKDTPVDVLGIAGPLAKSLMLLFLPTALQLYVSRMFIV
jgi:hypothetical protein